MSVQTGTRQSPELITSGIGSLGNGGVSSARVDVSKKINVPITAAAIFRRGHATVAAPSPAMNLRRFMSAPGLRKGILTAQVRIPKRWSDVRSGSPFLAPHNIDAAGEMAKGATRRHSHRSKEQSIAIRSFVGANTISKRPPVVPRRLLGSRCTHLRHSMKVA
jgi:hypothetical protein